jgi:WD40 repeat protein
MPQVRLIATLVITIFLTILLPQVDLAQADVLGNCTHAPDSRITRPDGVVIRNEYRNQRLLLASIETGEVVQVLDTSINNGEIAFLDWSPDCRYLFGSYEGDAVLWDTLNGGRVAAFENVDAKNPPYWNPARDNLILETRQGSFLWNYRQSEPLLLGYTGDFCATRYRYFNWQVEWDNARNQVLVVPNFVDGNTVIVYDQSSAQQVAAYDNGCLRGPVKFSMTPDNSYLIVFTSEDEAFPGTGKGITVWNRETNAHVSVDAGNQSAVLPSQIALSADASLLVLARVGVLRVWDLTNLAADVPARDPIRRYSIEPNTWITRFVDATTVETTDFGGIITRWNLVNGSEIE